MSGYALNKTGAMQANDKQSGYIDKNGDYVLKIESAEWIAGQAPKQSRGLRLALVDAAKNKAKIDLWFQKGDGTRNDMSANMLDGIMTCTGLQNLTEQQGKVTEYDKDVGGEAERNAVICPELTNKYFGALIQIETDAYMKDGSPKEIDKATFFGVYQFKTLLTPNEILNGETAAKQIHNLKEKLDSAKPRFTKQHKELMGGISRGEGSFTAIPSSYGNTKPADLDDDLPF